jgi:hypothetical protein
MAPENLKGSKVKTVLSPSKQQLILLHNKKRCATVTVIQTYSLKKLCMHVKDGVNAAANNQLSFTVNEQQLCCKA